MSLPLLLDGDWDLGIRFDSCVVASWRLDLGDEEARAVPGPSDDDAVSFPPRFVTAMANSSFGVVASVLCRVLLDGQYCVAGFPRGKWFLGAKLWPVSQRW